jgi:hypothetical protein
VLGDDEYEPPPSILYSTLNPEMAGTAGRVNMDAHELAGSVITGALGNTTALIVASWQPAVELVEPAAVEPQADVNAYLAFMVQQPGVLFNNAFAAPSALYVLNEPPGACTAYSAVKPLTAVTAVMLANAALQVFASGVRLGVAGKITMLTVLLTPHDPDPAVPAAVDPHALVKT